MGSYDEEFLMSDMDNVTAISGYNGSDIIENPCSGDAPKAQDLFKRKWHASKFHFTHIFFAFF